MKLVMPVVCLLRCAIAQTGPTNVSQVLMWSTVTNTNVGQQFSQNQGFIPNKGVSGSFPALLTVYTEHTDPNGLNNGNINTPSTYAPANPSALNSAISSAIGLQLALVPVASPASAVIRRSDPETGLELPASSTLGPIFTERAETIGKGRGYIGFSYQNFHFTEINGIKLNGLTVLYKGGDTSAIGLNGGKTAPATFNMGMDVRLSQELAFLTYGVTDRVDATLGLPIVHAAVGATAYNGQIFTGAGLGTNGNNCWCMNTFSPGTFRTTEALIGSSAMSKTGFGDLLVRVKGAVVSRSNAVVSIGGDLRLPTGDSDNYLGTGTTTVKPFVAVSLYTKPTASGFVLSPHFNIGWQFSGKSNLGGTIQGTPKTATLTDGSTVPYLGVPLTVAKDTLPDVFAWAVGTEFGLGRRNTLVVDVLGNQIGWINSAQIVKQDSAAGFSPTGSFGAANPVGVVSAGRGSFGQYTGSFGYKVRVARNLVATFNALVRFDNNGLTARFVPLYGLSYSF
jgi:hypothetical protein